MRLSLAPRDRRIFDLLCRHSGLISQAADSLVSGMKDGASPDQLQSSLKKLEHDGDDVTHQTVETLNRTFVTPFDREDILALITAMDDVLDYLEEVADIVVLYRIDPIPPIAQELAGYVGAAIHQMEQAIGKLQSGASIVDQGIEIDRLENLGDNASRRAIGGLFSDGLDTLEVIKLKDLYGALEATLDRCEDVADVLQTITVKYA